MFERSISMGINKDEKWTERIIENQDGLVREIISLSPLIAGNGGLTPVVHLWLHFSQTVVVATDRLLDTLVN
ncbi:unnamed protein product [Onchocerca flexuosa]|uniref:Transposase n=1 Tax=Onchocerca flexuosa TaxID=387005 RepID=A0A183H2M1_9BILA|nr:unnamed protein product [Onchocerca flexuosa]